LGANVTTAGNNWTSVARQTAGTATSVIRLRGLGTFGSDDIYIDNFTVTALSCAPPTALLYAPTSATGGTLSWTNPTAGTPTNYEYEIRTSGAAGSGATGLVTSGTIANPTNSATIALGTLSANTAYSAYIRTDCGGGDISGWSSATAFTTPCTPSVAPFSQTFATAYSLAPTGNPTCWREATGTINLSGNSTVTTGTNNWGSGNFANVAGNTGFKINLYGTNNAWVITEPITLGAGDWSLAYSMAVTTFGATGAVSDLGTHAVRVIVSTDFGTTWSSANIIKTYTGAAAYSTAGATEYVSLNSYAGQTIQVAFVATTSTTSPDIDFHLDNIAVIVPCSGTPVIGASAAASPTTLDCTGSEVSLTMDVAAQVGGGINYQWSSSTDGVTFSNISGATGSTYNTPGAIIISTYYRGTATCFFSDLTNTTADFFVEAGFPTPVVSAFPPMFCGTGGTSALTGTIAGANPYDTFVWAVGSGQTGVLSNETNTTADWTVTESAGFTYTVTDTTSGCSRIVKQSVNVLGGVNPAMSSTPSVVCKGGSAVIDSGLSASNFSYNTITFNEISAAGNTLAAGGTLTAPLTSGTLDDGGWGGIPIGFTFNFFGTNFSTCNVGTNGIVTFGAYNPSHMNDFTFPSLPSVIEPNPMVAVCAADQIGTLNSGLSGTIRYRTLGFPGNRIFVVSWEGWRAYNNTNLSTYQVQFYEATGNIEVHVFGSAATSNKIVGVNGPGGLVGAVAYSSTATITSPTAWRFLPPQNYTTTWTPSADISGSASGTNLFSRTTSALNTAGTINFNLQLTNQQTGCVSNAPFNLVVADPPSTPVNASIEAYGSSLGAASAENSPMTVCGDQDVTLIFVGALGIPDEVKWYDAAVAGNLLATNDTLILSDVAAGTSVWAAINNGACPETGRYEYVINYNTPPPVTVNSLGPDRDVNCGEGVTYNMSYLLASAASPAYVYAWSNDGNAATFVDNGGGSATLSSDETTASTYTAFQPGTGCTTTAQKSFGVYPFPVIVPTAADTAICIGDSLLISSNLSVTNFSVKCVPFSFRTALGNETYLAQSGIRNNSFGGTISLDDGGWESIPLGFTFNYFGADFSAVNVGTNGVIHFGPYANFNPNQYSFQNGFPSTNSPVNTIGVLATDLYMTNTGYVRFWTEGAAPNRVFVLEYNSPGWISDGNHNAQVHLYETLGLVEIHVNQATGTGAFAGPKTIGLQNGTGTIGATAPVVCDVNGNQGGWVTWYSRVSTITTADPKGWRFSPPVTYTFAWAPGGEIAGSTNNSTALAAPTATSPGVTTYSITVTDNLSGCIGTPVALDIILADCSCTGTFADADNDGTCDANDLCSGAEPGSACDDNDPCTTGDVILADCSCAGTFADADNDGTCDANDLCSGAEPGSACDDNDPCTVNDVILADCSCTGTFADADNDGTCDANDLCAGAEPGSSCDDSDPCTVNDIILADCSCAGTFTDNDFDGTCDANDLCSGAEPGSECNDGDPCTMDDVILADCSCAGTFADADNDGTCDASDVCEGPEPGSACDDGNACTTGDLVRSDCSCRGIAIEPQFSSVSANACGPYSWNNNTYTQSGTYQVTLQNAAGCDSIAQLVLTVGTPTTSSQSVTACGSYSWNGSTYTQTGTYTYVTTNASGCPNTATLNLTINTLSTAPTGASASQTSVSSGTSVTLTVQGGLLGTGAAWKWYRGACGGTLIGTGSSITVTANATNTYFVRAEGTCNTTTCAAVTVNVQSSNPCGPQSVSATATTICLGGSSTLSVQGTLGTGASWKWYRSGCGSIAVATGASISVAPTATTTYFVRSEGGTCGTTSCLSITVTVNTVPGIPQGIVLPATLCRNQPAVISILNPIAGLSYFWEVPSGWLINGGQGTATINVLVGQGNGQIRVYAFNSCGNSKRYVRSVSPISCSTTQAFTTGTNDIHLWPNPASERIQLSFDGDTQPDHLQIYDMLGRDIYNGQWVREFDVSNLAGGIYFVRATSGGESVVKRMEVIR